MANKQEHRSAFENQWKEAFEDAEITPSTDLWKNIDNQLTMQENGKYRKGFIFYRAVAAACIICLLGMGYYVLQNGMDKSNNELSKQPAQEKLSPEEQTPDHGLALEEEAVRNDTPEAEDKARELHKTDEDGSKSALANEQTNKSTGKKNSSKQTASLKHNQKNLNADIPSASQRIVHDLMEQEDNTTLSPTVLSETLIAGLSLDYIPSMGPELSEIQESNWVKDIHSLFRVPQAIIDDQKKGKAPEFFAGLNLATNYFDPNFSAGGNRSIASSFSPPANDFVEAGNLDQGYNTLVSRSTPANSGLENKPQLSLSYGVDVGFMLTKHLSLESGLDYGRMNSRTQTSWVAEDYRQGERIPLLASNANTSTQFDNSTQFTPQEQELTNSFAFLSVPLKLGYNLGFERINFNLSSGVAANFFLNNRLSDESGQLRTVNISASADSPYRPVYYSGVVSGGVNYLIASSYALSLSPNYNFSLSALTEDGNSFSSQPNAFGVDFGIRYTFR